MQHIHSQLTTAQKVQFLSQPTSYAADSTESVDVIETHMSWVFLTKHYVYKLKKPSYSAFFDFRTIAARYQDCQAELRLNRRLAPQVYLDVVPLTIDPQGELQLGTDNAVIDWLVKMRRLPADAMLDVVIKQRTITQIAITQLGQHLTHFYQTLPPVDWSAKDYRHWLKNDLQTTLSDLQDYANGLSGAQLSHLLNQLIGFLQAEPAIFDHRIYQGKVIEGHGDLRPEHICLRPEIAIIDCLEFNRALRTLDCVDELAFLSLECERLGVAWVGDAILKIYCHIAQDDPPASLIHFYKAYRACLRAKLAVWHLPEPGHRTTADWVDRAQSYLRLAEKYLPQCR